MAKIQVFPNDNSPGLKLAIAHGLVRLGLLQRFLKNGFDITPSHWNVLCTLWESDNVTQTDLAKKAGLDRPNLTRILGRLEKKGFVERKPNPDDHRSYIIQLTKTGREAKAPLISIVEAHLNEVVMGMSQKEYDAGIRFLRIVIDNLRHVKNGG